VPSERGATGEHGMTAQTNVMRSYAPPSHPIRLRRKS